MLWVTPILEIKRSPAFLLHDCSRAGSALPSAPRVLAICFSWNPSTWDPAIIVGVCHGPSCLLILTVVVCAHLAAGEDIVNSGIAAGSWRRQRWAPPWVRLSCGILPMESDKSCRHTLTRQNLTKQINIIKQRCALTHSFCFLHKNHSICQGVRWNHPE